MLATVSPLPQYFGLDGKPLDAGEVYFGAANDNPETSPITVYWDAAGTQPADQPIRTINGYTVRSGTPATVYAATDYSVTVKDRKGRIVIYARTSQEFNAESRILADLASPAAGKGAHMLGNAAVVLSVKDSGVLPGASYALSNCAAFKALIARVRVLGSNVHIHWPPGVYYFAPKDDPTYSGGAAYAWRGDIELVDVVNVYHYMPGVTIYHRADAGWYRGNSTPVAGLDEGPIQFRASTAGACQRVGVIGPCTIKTDATLADTTLTHGDGAAMGIAYRGCQNTITAYCRFEYWGTDGLYIGAAYSSAFGGENHLVIDPRTYRCYRQGISIVRNSHGLILGGSLEETQGGSFGHGIDFEPDGSGTQSNWTLIGTRTRNNQRGACNFINTSDVTWFLPDIDEQHASASATVYVDGPNVANFDVRNIRFVGGKVVGLQPVLYVSGVAAAGPFGWIDNIEFLDCELGSYADSASLNGGAVLRINPSGYTSKKIGRIKVRGGSIRGNGGVTIKGDGSNPANLTIDDVDWYTTNPNGSTVTFVFGNDATATVDLRRVRHSIDTTKTMATYTPVIPRGSIKDCTFKSHSGALLEWKDSTVGWTTEIGWNDWSTYSYYKGVVNALDLKIPGAVQEKKTGDFGIAYRVMHGGRQRVSNYVASPSLFTGAQAPADGDTTSAVANSGTTLAVTGYVYDGALSAWRQSGYIMKKGGTGARPTPGTNLTAADTGVGYLDTTLNANGKPIWWNGSAWVDSTGATV